MHIERFLKDLSFMDCLALLKKQDGVSNDSATGPVLV